MRKLAALALAVAIACAGDSIVSVDWDDTGNAFQLRVGQTLDVRVVNCISGFDAPSVSSDALEYRGWDLDGPPTPGCHKEKHHFLGKHAGVADVVFRRVFRYDSAGVHQERPLDSLAYRIDVH